MNGNEIDNNASSKNTYHATSNLNTAIENPQANIDSAIDVNIKNTEVTSSNDQFNNQFGMDSNGYFQSNGANNYSNLNGMNNQVDSGNFSHSDYSENNTNYNSSNSIESSSNASSSLNVTSGGSENGMYQPVMEKNKRNDKKAFKVSREFKIMIFVVFILVLFILVMPYIYDFFRELSMA